MAKSKARPVSLSCPACEGGGSITCPTCKGSGDDPAGDACCACRGAREIRCLTCHGSGHAAPPSRRTRVETSSPRVSQDSGRSNPPRGEQEFIVSRSSAERFIKEYAKSQNREDARVRVDAVQRFAGYIDQIALTLVADALRRAGQARRNTIQIEDIDAAYTTIAGGTASPEGLFSSIDKLDTDQLANLVNIITTWLKDKQPGVARGKNP